MFPRERATFMCGKPVWHGCTLLAQCSPYGRGHARLCVACGLLAPRPIPLALSTKVHSWRALCSPNGRGHARLCVAWPPVPCPIASPGSSSLDCVLWFLVPSFRLGDSSPRGWLRAATVAVSVRPQSQSQSEQMPHRTGPALFVCGSTL